MDSIKSFLAGVLVTSVLGIVCLAVWVIADNGRSLNATNFVNSVPIQPTAESPTVLIIEGESGDPVIRSLVPTVLPTLQPTQTATAVPENIIDYEDVLARPTRDYELTNDQLAACIQAQQTARRLAPYCPPNPAEYAGQGR